MLISDFRKLVLIAFAATGAIGFSTAFAQDAKEETPQKKRRVIVIENDDAATDVDAEVESEVNIDVDSDPKKRRRIVVRKRDTPKYWIGVACTMTDDGISIGEVLPDSPAAKAGLKSGDQILTADNFAVAELSDLVEAVQSDNPITIKVRRDNETLELEVTPAERPRDLNARREQWEDIQLDEGWGHLMPHLRGLLDGEIEDFDISMIQPGVVFDPADIPNGVSISIRRDNDGPAKISIKRGDDSWEVTEDSIDKLPADLQATAKRMLSATGGRINLNSDDVHRLLPQLRISPERLLESRRRRNANDDELRGQMEEMRKEIRELRELLKELKDN